MMKKVIVTTTINPPTEAIEMFDNMSDWELVVIGDLKTPKNYKLSKGHFISTPEQEKLDRKLSDAIGWNCIQRRNFGFLIAMKMGADIIATVDDDNIPYENWGKDLILGIPQKTRYYHCSADVFDPIGATNHSNLWHRGFPLTLIPERNYTNYEEKEIIADVQADFWNGDPDIDAFCRMEHRPECEFDNNCFPIASNQISPFNSQNTFLKSSVLKDYFMFPHVGRMDDIWGSYYVSALNYNIVYCRASVYQKRNNHNLIEDMKAEYLGYEFNVDLVKNLKKSPRSIEDFLPSKSIEAFNLYKKHFFNC